MASTEPSDTNEPADERPEDVIELSGEGGPETIQPEFEDVENQPVTTTASNVAAEAPIDASLTPREAHLAFVAAEREFDPFLGALFNEDPEQEFELPPPHEDLQRPPDPDDLPPENLGDWPVPEETPLWSEEITGEGRAAMFVSDFHMSDGTIGDDFFEASLQTCWLKEAGSDSQERRAIGNEARGASRAGTFASVLTFVLARLAERGITELDIVLSGDIVDFLEMRARGSRLSPQHFGFFGTLAAARDQGHRVYYLRGNHDFIIPPGPWTRTGAIYANAILRTHAEHGDRYDALNWPPGFLSTGSQLVRLVSPAENVVTPLSNTESVYLFAALDNLRPLIADVLQKFLAARTGNVAVRGQVLPLLNFLARLKGFNSADDLEGFRQAIQVRLQRRFFNWITVQGHTHIPIAIPTVHYNTGSWLSTVVYVKRAPLLPFLREFEAVFDWLPFLLVYNDPNTNPVVRREEFYTLEGMPQANRLTLRNQAGVNEIRRRMGHPSAP